jgi:hypothetical protein
MPTPSLMPYRAAQLPDTAEEPQLAAALVVTQSRAAVSPFRAPVVQGNGEVRLVVIRVVDFYRDDLFRS